MDSNFNFLWGRAHGAGPPPPVHMRPPEPDPLPLRVDVINGWPLYMQHIAQPCSVAPVTSASPKPGQQRKATVRYYNCRKILGVNPGLLGVSRLPRFWAVEGRGGCGISIRY